MSSSRATVKSDAGTTEHAIARRRYNRRSSSRSYLDIPLNALRAIIDAPGEPEERRSISTSCGTPPTVQRQFREGRLIDRTKKNKIRVVDLSREVCEEFRAHRTRMQREALAAGHPLSEFVFLTRLGEPIRSKSSFERRVFHRVVRLAGLTRRVIFQHLRQTFCSDIVASSGDLLYASEQAGHASVKITGDYYSHYRPGQKRHIMDGLDERVRQATPRP